MMKELMEAYSKRCVETCKDPTIIIIPALKVEAFLKEMSEYVHNTTLYRHPDGFFRTLTGFKFHGVRVISSPDLSENEIICL